VRRKQKKLDKKRENRRNKISILELDETICNLEFRKIIKCVCFVFGIIFGVLLVFWFFNSQFLKDTSKSGRCHTNYQNVKKILLCSQNSQLVCENKNVIFPEKDTWQHTIDNTLSTAANTISTASKTINYFSFFLLILGVVVTFAFISYFKKYIKLIKQLEKAENSVLDAAMMTISSVRLVDATQIFSCEHKSSVTQIANLVKDRKYTVDMTPKYARLIIVEALKAYCDEDYSYAIERLEKAKELSYRDDYDDTTKIVAFHLFKAHRQKAYDLIKKERSNKKIKKELEKAEDYLNLTDDSQKYGALVSIHLIRWHFITENNEAKREEAIRALKDSLINCFNYNRDDKYKDLVEIVDKIKNDEETLDTLNKQTAITTIILRYDLFPSINKKDLSECAKKVVKILDAAITDFNGANIKASWYLSLSQLTCFVYELSDTLSPEHSKYKEDTLHYCILSRIYLNRSINTKRIKSLLLSTYLTEVNFSTFGKELEKIEKGLLK